MTRATHRPRFLLLLATGLLAGSAWLLAAAPAFACSCAGDQPMATYATKDTAIFSGLTGPRDARGVPVRVDEWFWGADAQAVVYLAGSSFEDSSSCGTAVPPAGTTWIWVTYLGGPGEDPSTGLCSPHAELGTPDGTRLLADVRAFFGGVAPPGGEPPAPSATPPPAAPDPNPPVDPAAAAVPIIVGTVGLGMVVLLGAAIIAGRRSRPVR